jgi:hypothetical protein
MEITNLDDIETFDDAVSFYMNKGYSGYDAIKAAQILSYNPTSRDFYSIPILVDGFSPLTGYNPLCGWSG